LSFIKAFRWNALNFDSNAQVRVSCALCMFASNTHLPGTRAAIVTVPETGRARPVSCVISERMPGKDDPHPILCRTAIGIAPNVHWQAAIPGRVPLTGLRHDIHLPHWVTGSLPVRGIDSI
jgi:hypothetical protein